MQRDIVCKLKLNNYLIKNITIMNAQKSIAILQMYGTGLANGAFAHLVQGKHFDSMGFHALGAKYTGHYEEEMGWVNKFIERINDLGGEFKIEDQKGRALVKDPVEYVKCDLEIQRQGVDTLYKSMQELADDPTSYDIMKAYLADEEEDLYWSEEQLDMIDMIGRQNWLMKQM